MACLCYRPHTRHVVRMLYLTWKNTHCLSLVRSTFVSMERWIPAFFGSVAETLSEAWEAKPCLALPSGFMYICIYLINFLRLKSLRNLNQVMFAALNFYSYNEDRRHMAFSSFSCHTPKISSLLGLFLFLWLGAERGIMGVSFRGVAVQAFSSCSVRTGGPGRRAGDGHPSETVWHCPLCSVKELMSWCTLSPLCSCCGSPRRGRVCCRSFCRREGGEQTFAAGCLISAYSAFLCNSELPIASSWLSCGCAETT